MRSEGRIPGRTGRPALWLRVLAALAGIASLVAGVFFSLLVVCPPLGGGGGVWVLLPAVLGAEAQAFGVAFGGGLISDAAATFAKVAIYLASAVAIPLGQSWFERRGVRAFEFPVLILLAALGMGMMVGSGDLI